MALEVDYDVYGKDLMEGATLWLRELKGKLGVKAEHTVVETMVVDAIGQEVVRRRRI
jgi:hypothetical protein